MSVITPLLDTLLHDVLGKRMDAPGRRDLNEAVKPTASSDAPLSIHSDSRLDSRRPLLPEQLTKASRQGGEATTRPPAQAPLQSDLKAPASRILLSPAARVIGDILAKYPAPPSVVRAPLPLLAVQTPDRQGAEILPAQVAESLQTSIKHSGLFYESHLKRWYRGEVTIQQLAREPQMQLSTPGPATRQRAGEPLSPRGSVPSSVPPSAITVQHATGVQHHGGARNPGGKESATASSSAEAGWQQRAGNPAPEARLLEASEHLQGLVRHQLELLTTPVLRWEGDLWSGVFMALMVHAPEMPGGNRNTYDGAEDEAETEEDREWHSELSLELRDLGHLQVSLRLKREQLGLDLRVPSTAVLAQLEAGRQGLLERLQACGFSRPRLSISLSEAQRDG